MKKSMKILAGITAFILIGGILWFANGLLGNPISKGIANNTVKKYVAQNYSDMDLEVSKVYYSFKDGYYHADIKSPTSKDTYFTVSISPLGKIGYDSYEYSVVEGYNTYKRLDESYNSKVKSVFENKDFPYKSDIYYGEIKDISSQEVEGINANFGPAYGLNISELELDKDYNINEIGKKYGHIVFYIQDNDISIERASEILLDIKAILDEKQVSFYAIDFNLEEPRTEDEQINPNDECINIQEFLYSDIYEKGLEGRIEKAADDLQKYYKEQDKIKAEMESVQE